MKQIQGGVCAAQGFRAAGIWCGIRVKPGKRDLALIYSEAPCVSSAVFTTNKVKAASLLVTREHSEAGKLRAIIANSGNANACTGPAGLAAARCMAELVADEFAIPVKQVAVASTGVIGVPLPIAAIESEVSALANALRPDNEGNEAAVEAIMTTDKVRKYAALEIELDGKAVRIGAICKGSGMIHPNMATMLCFITTDANIEASALDKALRRAVQTSFNRLTIDGDTSTNDMVLILANARAGNEKITEYSKNFEIFEKALTELCLILVRKMAKDGEGATKLLAVTVHGAQNETDAELLAKAVAASSLVKTAIFGADANWGRVICALGYAGAAVDQDFVDISFASAAGSLAVCEQGRTLDFSEELAKEVLVQDEVTIDISVGAGPGSATVWGCDLSYDYVKINGAYRT